MDSLSFKNLFFILQLLLWLFLTPVKAEDVKFNSIPLLSNLNTDAERQKESGRVIMLYVSDPNCVFCKKLEKEILNPLMISGEYDSRIILRKIVWHSQNIIKDFNSVDRRPYDFLKAYEIKVTPTLLFLDAQGKQLVKPLLGFRGGEFYWYYFDAAINKANKRLNDLEDDTKP